ncbi:MAG TPA: DUF1932 domain-containing protein [Povalibacter sp.]
MSSDVHVCLLGFGEVGKILATDLQLHGVQHISAWDTQFADPDSAPAKAVRSSGVTPAADAAQAVARATWVISAVTAAQDVAAAESVTAHLAPDAFFMDLNSVSPGVKQQAAAMIGAGRGRYVEAAIMAPIAPRRIASPILLGGPHARQFATIAHRHGFAGAEVFSDSIGQASAAKMCRSVIIKGMEALLTESLLAARHYGVEDTVIQSLNNLIPGSDWRSLARYMISRSLQHGARRAEEMRQAAVTVGECGLTPWMSGASAERQQWAAQFGALAAHEPLDALLDSFLAAAAENQSC